MAMEAKWAARGLHEPPDALVAETVAPTLDDDDQHQLGSIALVDPACSNQLDGVPSEFAIETATERVVVAPAYGSHRKPDWALELEREWEEAARLKQLQAQQKPASASEFELTGNSARAELVSAVQLLNCMLSNRDASRNVFLIFEQKPISLPLERWFDCIDWFDKWHRCFHRTSYIHIFNSAMLSGTAGSFPMRTLPDRPTLATACLCTISHRLIGLTLLVILYVHFFTLEAQSKGRLVFRYGGRALLRNLDACLMSQRSLLPAVTDDVSNDLLSPLLLQQCLAVSTLSLGTAR